MEDGILVRTCAPFPIVVIGNDFRVHYSDDEWVIGGVKPVLPELTEIFLYVVPNKLRRFDTSVVLDRGRRCNEWPFE